MSRRVEIINAVSAVRENYRQARLIVWEIARREHSIEVLASKGHFRLKNEELELDKELFRGIEEMDRPTVADVRVRDLGDDPLKKMREVVADQKWLEADGAYLCPGLHDPSLIKQQRTQKELCRWPTGN